MPEYKDTFITDLLCRNNLLETELRNARYEAREYRQLAIDICGFIGTDDDDQRRLLGEWDDSSVNTIQRLAAENEALRRDNLRLVNDLEAEGIEITQTRQALFNFKALLNEIREIVRVTSLSSGSADYRDGIAKLVALLYRTRSIK